MSPRLRTAFEKEMTAAHERRLAGDLDGAIGRLERAHVLGQRHVAGHVRTHWWMLRIGLRRRSLAEVAGQALRIVAGAVGSAVGIVPVGNTGGTDVFLFARMPIAPDLQEVLDDVRRAPLAAGSDAVTR